MGEIPVRVRTSSNFNSEWDLLSCDNLKKVGVNLKEIQKIEPFFKIIANSETITFTLERARTNSSSQKPLRYFTFPDFVFYKIAKVKYLTLFWSFLMSSATIPFLLDFFQETQMKKTSKR